MGDKSLQLQYISAEEIAAYLLTEPLAHLTVRKYCCYLLVTGSSSISGKICVDYYKNMGSKLCHSQLRSRTKYASLKLQTLCCELNIRMTKKCHIWIKHQVTLLFKTRVVVLFIINIFVFCSFCLMIHAKEDNFKRISRFFSIIDENVFKYKCYEVKIVVWNQIFVSSSKCLVHFWI